MNLKTFRNLPKSYWIASTSENKYPSLEEDIDVDIAIVGGGMVGISTAYQLRDVGFKIAILEAENIIMSTTAHTTAKLTSQHGLIYDKMKSQMGDKLAQQYASANEMAIHEIKKIANENNIQCDYMSESAFIYTQDDEYIKKIENEVDAAISLGINASYVDSIPFPLPIKAGIRFDNQAQFHPRKFLLPLANIIHNEGISIYEYSRVTEMDEDGDKYILTTSQGKKVRASKVIIASHYPFYNKPSMYYARLYVKRAYIVAIRAKEKYPGGMYINAETPARSLRQVNTDNGELILVVGESPWEEVYNPSRKTVLASAKNFVVQNVNVATKLIEGKVSNIPDNLDIQQGEAQVVEIQGERIGAFKDDNGKLYFVDTTCTHMGCELNWNSAERSWDCPCHGSRFTYDGKIIQGPAVEPLNFGDDVNTLLKVLKEDF